MKNSIWVVLVWLIGTTHAVTIDCDSVSSLLVQIYGNASISACCSLTATVSCSGNEITSINATGLLTGTIPDVRNLRILTSINLPNNALTGTLPSFSGMTNLESLNLSNNSLTGALPSTLGELTSLKMLNIRGNALEGTLPANSFGYLTQLTSLFLWSNKLSGTIPSTANNLSHLADLVLSFNQLTGSIPDFSNLAQLTYLNLYANLLTGSIPEASLSGSVDLEHLYLGENYLSGSLPLALSQLTRLVVLNLHANYLTGSIPDAIFSNFTQLISIGMGSNFLTGSLPPFDVNNSQLSWMGVANNFLTGSLPSTFCNLTKLTQLYLSNNFISGSLPSCVGQLKSMKYLYIDANYLSGTIPSSISEMTSLHTLLFNENDISGLLPDLSALQDLELLYGGYNSLSGPIPDLQSLFKLDTVYLALNQLTGTLPKLPNSPHSKLRMFHCSWNYLYGALEPDTFANQTLMEILVLEGNYFTGSLPDISELTLLQTVELGINQLVGPIPKIELFSSLEKLDLSYNQFSGTVPNMNTLPVLTYLNLNSNKLTGALPPAGEKLYVFFVNDNALSSELDSLYYPTVSFFDISGNQLTGVLDTITFPDHALVDISGNEFTCPYPEVPSGMAISRSDCLIDYTSLFLIVLAGVLFALVAGSVFLFYTCWCEEKLQQSEPESESELGSSTSIITYAEWIIFFILWALEVLDFFTDANFNIEAIKYVSQDYSPCEPLNYVFVTGALTLNGETYPPLGSYSSFNQYYTLVQQIFGDSQDYLVDEFQVYCEWAGCAYQSSDYSCYKPQEELEHNNFLVIVWLVSALIILKEVFKTVCVLVALKKGVISEKYEHICTTSVFSPLFLLSSATTIVPVDKDERNQNGDGKNSKEKQQQQEEENQHQHEATCANTSQIPTQEITLHQQSQDKHSDQTFHSLEPNEHKADPERNEDEEANFQAISLMTQLVTHVPSWKDLTSELLIEGCLENIPQLVLSLYYFTSVVQTGLDTLQIISVMLSIVSSLKMVAMIIYLIIGVYCQDADQDDEIPIMLHLHHHHHHHHHGHDHDHDHNSKNQDKHHLSSNKVHNVACIELPPLKAPPTFQKAKVPKSKVVPGHIPPSPKKNGE